MAAGTFTKSPYRLEWACYLLALMIAVAAVAMALFAASVFWAILLCPAACGLVFGGLLHGNRVTNRLREEAKR